MPAPAIVVATLMRPEGETGVQSHFRTFHRWLAGHQRAVRIVTPFDAPRWKVLPVFGLRRAVQLASKPGSVWWYRHWHAAFLRQALRDVLRSSGDCVIYAQCPLSAQAALLARKSPRQRVVMAVHFNVSQADEWQGKGMLGHGHPVFTGIRKLEGAVLTAVDGLVFVSDFMRRELIGRWPSIDAARSVVIPNFVDRPDTIAPIALAHGDLISIGTLEPRKNQAYLLDIISATRAIGRGLRLTLAGDGPDRGALEEKARRMGIDDLVTFAGHVPDAARHIPEYRACIHMARLENLPITLIEALSCGRPVFAAAVGGVPEIFTDGREGWTLPLDNAQEAAKLLSQFLHSDRELEAAGRAARARFEEHFETSTTAARLDNFLLECPARG